VVVLKALCVLLNVCVRKREKERTKGCVRVCERVSVYACARSEGVLRFAEKKVCVREREREREREGECMRV